MSEHLDIKSDHSSVNMKPGKPNNKLAWGKMNLNKCTDTEQIVVNKCRIYAYSKRKDNYYFTENKAKYTDCGHHLLAVPQNKTLNIFSISDAKYSDLFFLKRANFINPIPGKHIFIYSEWILGCSCASCLRLNYVPFHFGGQKKKISIVTKSTLHFSVKHFIKCTGGSISTKYPPSIYVC